MWAGGLERWLLGWYSDSLVSMVSESHWLILDLGCLVFLQIFTMLNCLVFYRSFTSGVPMKLWSGFFGILRTVTLFGISQIIHPRCAHESVIQVVHFRLTHETVIRLLWYFYSLLDCLAFHRSFTPGVPMKLWSGLFVILQTGMLTDNSSWPGWLRLVPPRQWAGWDSAWLSV